MSLKYTRPTGRLFRLTNCQNLIYCVQRNLCNDPPNRNKENVSEKKGTTAEASKEESENTDNLKMEKLLKTFSQSSAQSKSSELSETNIDKLTSNTLKGKYSKSYSYDNKKMKQQTKDVEPDFFASLKTRKYDVASDDQEKKEESGNERVQAAKLKMSELLKSLSQAPDSDTSKIELSHPKPRKKKTEFKGASFGSAPDIDLSVQKAVKEVAKELGGDTKEIESDLFASLKSHSTETSLSDLLATMKIDRSSTMLTSEKKHRGSSHKSYKDFHEDKEEVPLRSRLNDFRRKEFKKDYRKSFQVGMYSGTPLDIFPKDYKGEGVKSMLSTWDLISDRDKEVAVSNFPRNAFEEMIQWTEEGKLWTFPIDNEIGLEDEKKYGFADHIFLERHLEGWCPKRGPIRRYMELVCTGLSKNPYLTVERKKSHIEWYKNYFDEKKSLLQEIGAM